MGGTFSLVGTIFGQMTQSSNYGKEGFEEHSKNFVAEDLQVDLTGKNILITGANSGIGKESALTLAKLKASVHMICRNKERGEKAREEIVQQSENENVELHVLDVSVLSDVRRFSEQWLESGKPIHAILYNAGALANKREETSEGFEQTLACHVLGPFLLTKLFQKHFEEHHTRVIWVTSAGMYSQKLDVYDLQSKSRQPFDGTRTYAQMKRAQVILTEMWAEKLKNAYVVSVHPGWARTPGVDSLFEDKPIYRNFESSFRSIAQGADSLIWLCAKDTAPVSGRLYFDREIQRTTVRGSFTESDPQDRKILWEKCENLTAPKDLPQ